MLNEPVNGGEPMKLCSIITLNNNSINKIYSSTPAPIVTNTKYRKWRRTNGLQLPLHPQQVIGWLALGVSAGVLFFLLIPTIKKPIVQTILLALFTILYILHGIAHVFALLVDPADVELRTLREAYSEPVPDFDRTKYRHVIENGHCHLCNIKISSGRTKHCSVCNKCVEHFDHHCKWLNHCIGSRNYTAFLMCVTTAVLTALAVLVLCATEIILYYVHPELLAFHTEENNATVVQNGGAAFTTSDIPFLIIIVALAVVAAITAALLLHLCFFHVYISYLGLTTYEYIRTYRPNLMSTNTAPTNTTSMSTSNTSITRDSVTPQGNSGLIYRRKLRPSSFIYCCEKSEKHSYNLYPTNNILKEKLSKKVDNVVQQDIINTQSNPTTTTKSPLKRQRNKKWNCCSSVPDSPEEVLPTTNGTEDIGPTSSPDPSSGTEPPNNKCNRAALRIRLLFRILNNFRSRNRQRINSTSNEASVPTISNKANQVVPLNNQQQPETAEPLSRVPAVLPPAVAVRRRMLSADALTNVLAADNRSRYRLIGTNNNTSLSTLNSSISGRHLILYKRPKSPTLSPIHESGLSNPTSPVPGHRHVMVTGSNNSNSSSTASSTTSQSALNNNTQFMYSS